MHYINYENCNVGILGMPSSRPKLLIGGDCQMHFAVYRAVECDDEERGDRRTTRCIIYE